MRDEALIQISYEASLFPANHNPLKRKTERYKGRECDGERRVKGKVEG